MNISNGDNFSNFNTSDLTFYFNSPIYITSKIPNLCLTIVNFACQGIIFVIGFKKCENKCLKCLSGFFFNFLSVICLLIDLCVWYLDHNKVKIFRTLKTKNYPSIDDKYPGMTNKEDTYTFIYFWISIYSVLYIFIQFFLKMNEKECCSSCCCCCGCCKEKDPEKFEKKIKLFYLIADIVLDV